ncbi:GrpB family protein [Ornithinimicrobium cerasi]|uniref:GrpB family protein n=1 Tax=Ornithinimicrobium cerasi TaxID=2248773 RepID=UPI000EFF32EA|nr:GrpB family protein [Ornithinimicrobium cerasi]
MTHELGFAEYDPNWPSRFEQLRITLLTDLPAGAVVEHVGSTAVPGLASKDCIDILVTVPSDHLQIALAGLTAAGFEHRPTSFSEDSQRFMLRLLGPQRQRVAHLHLMAEGHIAAAQMVAVRDLLRRDRNWRGRYALIKRSLADQFPQDRPSFRAACQGRGSGACDRTGTAGFAVLDEGSR